MSDPTQITDHVTDGLEDLISQYHDSEVLRAYLTTLLQPLQDLEDVVFEIRDALTIDTATGDLLDKFASLVGLENLTGTDAFKRARIKAQILVITSNANSNDFLNVILLLNPDAEPTIEGSYPAQAVLQIGDDMQSVPLTGEEVFDIVKHMPAAGVRLYVIFAVTSTATTFQFADDGSVQNNAALGFGNVGQSTGGHLAGVRAN
jgi:hypothetical protein